MQTFIKIKNKLLKIHASIENRFIGPQLSLEEASPITKLAFDTRRIDQEHTFNPRRNLQSYERSDPFIDDTLSQKINLFFKVKTAADLIKEDFYGDPDWLDSKTRILCNAVDNVLRTEQKDYDFSKKQFDYLDELLYMRYRLASDNINKLSENELKNIFLNRDEKLVHKSIYAKYDNKSIMEKRSDSLREIVKNISQDPENSKSSSSSVKNNDGSKTVTININV